MFWNIFFLVVLRRLAVYVTLWSVRVTRIVPETGHCLLRVAKVIALLDLCVSLSGSLATPESRIIIDPSVGSGPCNYGGFGLLAARDPFFLQVCTQQDDGSYVRGLGK